MQPPRWFYPAVLMMMAVLAGSACYAAWAVGERGRYAYISTETDGMTDLLDTRTGKRCLLAGVSVAPEQMLACPKRLVGPHR